MSDCKGSKLISNIQRILDDPISGGGVQYIKTFRIPTSSFLCRLGLHKFRGTNQVRMVGYEREVRFTGCCVRCGLIKRSSIF